MKSLKRWLLPTAALLTGLAYAAPAAAEVVWRGDFEGVQDLSQWSKAQSMGGDRLQVVPAPMRPGHNALQVKVQQGDDPINGSGNRNELVKFDGASEGKEFFYGWSTLWPADYPMTPTWQVFMQWHHPGDGGAPPVRFVLGCSAADCGTPMPDTLFFIVNGKTQWTMSPVTRGTWHDFIMHIKWSADPGVGFVELWYDGQLVVPKRNVRTLFNASDTNYLKMGLYRDEATKPTATLYQDGIIQATSLEEAQQALYTASGTAGGGTTPAQPDSSTPQTGTGTPAVGQDASGSNTAVGTSPDAQQPGGTGLTPDVTAGATQAGPQGGCSATSAAALPWASLLGLGSLAFARRRLSRRAKAARPPSA